MFRSPEEAIFDLASQIRDDLKFNPGWMSYPQIERAEKILDLVDEDGDEFWKYSCFHEGESLVADEHGNFSFHEFVWPGCNGSCVKVAIINSSTSRVILFAWLETKTPVPTKKNRPASKTTRSDVSYSEYTSEEWSALISTKAADEAAALKARIAEAAWMRECNKVNDDLSSWLE